MEILTVELTDARVDFMGEQIAPGYFRVTGSDDPRLQQLITARPEFNVMRVDADCTLTTDEAEPIATDPRDDEPEPVDFAEARAWSRQVNDLQMTGRGA